MEDLKKIEEVLLSHCYDMSILKKDAPSKKKESILDSLIAAVVRSETSLDKLKECISEVNAGNVIDLTIFKEGGNMENYINPKWLKLAKALYRQRSTGLGTPNAASGEGELMFIFLSPDIKKPTRGDLTIGDESIELKGEGVRVIGKISGKNFRKKTLEILPKYNLVPNKALKTNLDSVELEKPQHRVHWANELSKLPLSRQKEFVSEWLSCLDNSQHNIDHLFDDNFKFDLLDKEIVKILYSSMVKDRSFDKFIILGDGSNVKILDGNIENFNEKVDNGTIKTCGDYFRINQDSTIGWYIE